MDEQAGVPAGLACGWICGRDCGRADDLAGGWMRSGRRARNLAGRHASGLAIGQEGGPASRERAGGERAQEVWAASGRERGVPGSSLYQLIAGCHLVAAAELVDTRRHPIRRRISGTRKLGFFLGILCKPKLLPLSLAAAANAAAVAADAAM